MVRSDAEKRLEEEKTQKDQTALKEYIIKMEENQRALLSRLQELEATLEGDSMTSIGLLDMLLKKIGSGGVVMGENETSAPPDRERSRSPSPPQNRRSGNNNRRAINR